MNESPDNAPALSRADAKRSRLREGLAGASPVVAVGAGEVDVDVV